MNYTPILSALITVSKALLIYKAYQERKKDIRNWKRRGLGELDAKDEAISIIEGVKFMVRKFMTLTAYGGNPTPSNWMLRLRTYGMTIMYNTAEDGRIRWINDEISMGRISFTMSRLRSMVHGLTCSIRNDIQEKLMFFKQQDMIQNMKNMTWAAGIPKLDLESYKDNPAEMTCGWNFLQDPRNSFEVDGEKWLYKRVLQHEELRQKMLQRSMSEAGEINWRKDAVKTYMQSVKRVKEQMLVLIHITGGQPAGGTEILSLLHRNSMDNCGTRGIFVENGLVSIVTGYHKTFGPSGKGKVVHRYLPKEVSELLVYYLWLVQPFVNILQIYEAKRREFSDFFWEPRPEKVAGNKDIAGILHEDYESDESISDEEIEGKNNEVAHHVTADKLD
ncbi:hypothetical protein K3495_g14903 [Podosphaera aphanis]|nr:hypothetical protein K3495_g14903 [Podosphaera aphanis]